ncbi:MAG: hypothetical protein KGZ82_08270 [Bacteroidales bacterium]|nr:hypothetical protein [Bacteroidales bacterium]
MAKLKKFGAFGGVFTPSILTILGVIMYMRLPMIAGEAGLLGTLGIILVAHLISITTGLSVSSIATDKKVKEGGTYYIISRSLGLPIGGTLGIALFVGLSFSVSLYLIGFSESFLAYLDMPVDINHIRIAGSIVLLAVTMITFISTSLAIKIQYLIMGAIFLSLLSIFFGNHDFAPSAPNLFGSGTGVPLMVLFGIFFPAVTGFEAGVSMSGDLADPKKSIPLGTISAIALGLFVYIGLAFFFAFTVDGQLLATDKQALFKIALVPQLVIAGIWGATLSSALGSILAAPRILQSTAIDKITHRFFANGTGPSSEPRNALLLTFVIAELGILIGELDIIARIVSIFFITTYGFLNLSAAFESLTSADFRPSFKTPAWVSIVGSLACILVMIQLDFLAMLGAIVILGSIFLLLKRRQLVLETGDAWSSVWATLVRTSLRRLNRSSIHARNWRPNIILFCGPDTSRPHLIETARAFSGRLGIFSAFELVETKETKLLKGQRYFSSTGKDGELQIHQHKCRNVFDGMDEIARVYGFAGVEPNTILMGWSKNEQNKAQFLNLIQRFEESEFNTVFLNYNPIRKFGRKKTIDVWWSGNGNNLTFCIFLLRHFTSSGDWKDANIRVLVIHKHHLLTEKIYQGLQRMLDHYRVNFEIKVIPNHIDGLAETDIISRESAQTDLCFIGLHDRQYQQGSRLYENALQLSANIGTYFLVNSSTHFECVNLIPETMDEAEETPVETTPLELPEIIPSKYEVIREDILKIDLHGQQVLKSFFEKGFGPLFENLGSGVIELQQAIKMVVSQTSKLDRHDDAYRRTKAIIKIKNDFYFRTNRVFDRLVSTGLLTQKAVLSEGIAWYLDQLDHDLLRFPEKLEIPYLIQDLKIEIGDPFGLKWFKFRKRLAHPFAKRSIRGKIRYADIATYYLRDNRQVFLAAFLEKFKHDLFHQLAEVRTAINEADQLLDKMLAEQAGNAGAVPLPETELQKLQDIGLHLKTRLDLVRDQSRHRLMFEFRKNLQLMSDEMGKANVNFAISLRKSHKKTYAGMAKKNRHFPEVWYNQMLQQVNKVYMDVILSALRSRISDKMQGLKLELAQQIDQYFMAELKRLKAGVLSCDGNPDELPRLGHVLEDFDERFSLLKDFERQGEEILKLMAGLPESLHLAVSEAEEGGEQAIEAMQVPLRKIVRFYLESRFIGITHEHLAKLLQTVKNSLFIIQELLSFSRFNLTNLPKDLPDKSQLVGPLINDLMQKLLKEEGRVLGQKAETVGLIDQALKDVFGKLSGYRIGLTVKEYSEFVRDHQGKRAIRSLDALMRQIRQWIKHAISSLLYSRSEGIILAKQLLDREEVASTNQKILTLIEGVSPSHNVVERLPQFYQNLFSCRSSISDDFWISREADELQFKTAIRRHKEGYHGGVLIIGERNTGKTAFSRHVAEKHFKKDRVYQLFPPAKGSTDQDDLVAELRKVTDSAGTADEILTTMPPASVLVVHDLELWWERSASGWEVVKLLMKLISDHSPKVFFVVNMNPFAYSLINKVLGLQHVFISIISLRPFDSKELQQLIMRRHRSSGLTLHMNNREINEVSEIRLARLFNALFDYAEGNPGVAMKAWLSNIVKVTDKSVYIKSIHQPDTRVLNAILDEWKLALVQLILHKRLSLDRVQAMFHLDKQSATDMLQAMIRTGLVEQRLEGTFIVNGFIEPHLIRELKKENLL